MDAFYPALRRQKRKMVSSNMTLSPLPKTCRLSDLQVGDVYARKLVSDKSIIFNVVVEAPRLHTISPKHHSPYIIKSVINYMGFVSLTTTCAYEENVWLVAKVELW